MFLHEKLSFAGVFAKTPAGQKNFIMQMCCIKKFVIFYFFNLLVILGNSQSQVKILPINENIELRWNYNTVFKIGLNIINNTDSTIFVPETPFAYAKNAMGIDEIGVEMRLNHSKQKKCCSPSIQYLFTPNLIPINPGKAKDITVKFPGDYFVKKGKYKVKFFLKIPFMKNKKEYYKYYSSNEIIINMI